MHVNFTDSNAHECFACGRAAFDPHTFESALATALHAHHRGRILVMKNEHYSTVLRTSTPVPYGILVISKIARTLEQ